MRKPLIVIGIILIAAAAVWKFALSPRWEQRFSDGWTWQASYLGTNGYPDTATGEYPPDQKFPEGDPVNLTERVVTATTAGALSGTINLDDHFETRDVNTNVVTWEFTFSAVVDPVTGQYVADEYKDDYFLFPRNTQKQTYHIRNSSYQGLPLDFQAEETVSGIQTYHFVYQDEMDNSAAYPDTPLAADQDIKCPGMDLEYWVEPTTGEIVKYKESCSGDIVYNTVTGEQVSNMSRWSGETTGDDLIRRVSYVQNQLATYLWTTRYIPLLLLLVSIGALGLGIAPRLLRTASEEKKAA